MYNNRLLKVIAVVGVLMAVATSGVASASAPTGSERSAALGQMVAVSPPPLDNPNGQWIGPETVSAALGQVAVVSPLDNPNGQWIGPETVSAALGQMAASAPAIGRGPFGSLQAAPAPVSTIR